jgi:hypothetical protein
MTAAFWIYPGDDAKALVDAEISVLTDPGLSGDL